MKAAFLWWWPFNRNLARDIQSGRRYDRDVFNVVRGNFIAAGTVSQGIIGDCVCAAVAAGMAAVAPAATLRN